MTRKKNTILRTLLIFSVTISLLACGGDDGDSSSGNSTDNSNNTSNSGTINEWQLIKAEEDESKDGTIGSIAVYRYDTSGKLLEIEMDSDTDNLSAVYSFVYNSEGQWTSANMNGSMSDTLVNWVETFDYEINGQLMSKSTDFFNDGSIELETIFYYDDGRLSNTQDFDYTEGGILDETVTFFYDTNGNLARTETDEDGNSIPETEYIYTYDANGNLIKAESSHSIWYYTWQPGPFILGKGIPIEWFLYQ
jgi:hypothetical protein